MLQAPATSWQATHNVPHGWLQSGDQFPVSQCGRALPLLHPSFLLSHLPSPSSVLTWFLRRGVRCVCFGAYAFALAVTVLTLPLFFQLLQLFLLLLLLLFYIALMSHWTLSLQCHFVRPADRGSHA